jgi:hypothetical protein
LSLVCCSVAALTSDLHCFILLRLLDPTTMFVQSHSTVQAGARVQCNRSHRQHPAAVQAPSRRVRVHSSAEELVRTTTSPSSSPDAVGPGVQHACPHTPTIRAVTLTPAGMASNSLLCCTTYHATIMSCVFDVSQFAPLKQGIANFYNESSGLWESVWGEHMHHGKGGFTCCHPASN